MKKLAITFLLLSTTTLASATDLICRIYVSNELLDETSFPLEANTKFIYGEEEGFRFMVNNLGASKYQIEVFNSNEENRSYATGFLRTSEDEIAWSFWSRDHLLESSCQLVK